MRRASVRGNETVRGAPGRPRPMLTTRTEDMASGGKKKTTMAKLARENRLRERRANKQAKKDARKQARSDHLDWPQGAPQPALSEAEGPGAEQAALTPVVPPDPNS